MNFQTVSTAEKLPRSNGLPGGYLADGVTPGPLLVRALNYINTNVGAMVEAINDRHLAGNTVIILSAKHGQSPQTPSALTRIPDGPIMDALNAAWAAANPSATAPLVAFSINDDGMLVWLSDRSRTATDFARNFLLNHAGAGNDINGNPKAYTASGLKNVLAGADAAAYFHVAVGDARVPDVFGVSQYGVVYTGGKGKIAEHGGANPQDRAVPLIVSGAGIGDGEVNASMVETTSIAPTIARLLGLTRMPCWRCRSSTHEPSRWTTRRLFSTLARLASTRRAGRPLQGCGRLELTGQSSQPTLATSNLEVRKCASFFSPCSCR